MGDFNEALTNFNDTLSHLRGNVMIDYSQLGLEFKLFACEALFNRGLCYIYLNQRDVGMNDLLYASQEKKLEHHDVIDEAISEEAEVGKMNPTKQREKEEENKNRRRSASATLFASATSSKFD